MTTISNPTVTPGLRQLFDAAQSRDALSDAAQGATRNDPFTQAAKLAFQDIGGIRYDAGVSAKESTGAGELPRLAMPRVQVAVDPKQAQDTYTLLMGNLIMLLGEMGVSETETRLQILKNMAQANTAGFERASAAYQAAIADLDAANGMVETGMAQLAAAREQLVRAQGALADAEEALVGLDPDSDQYRATLQLRNQAQATVNAASQTVARAEQSLTHSMDAAQASLMEAERLAQELQQGTTGPLSGAVAADMKRQLNASAMLSLLMLEFAKLMGESADEQLKTQQELFKDMQTVRQAYLEEKSVEYQKQVEAAEKMSRIGGCIGKVLGILAMVAGAVMTVVGPLTGGTLSVAGVALFAVGLAVSAGDMVTKELTGFSYMEKAMQPLMQHVLMPAVEFVVNQMTALFKALEDSGLIDFLGLPENFAEMAGAITGTLLAVVAMIAAVVVVAMAGSAAASKLAEQFSGAVSKMVEKAIPKLLQHMVDTGVDAFQQAVQKIASYAVSAKIHMAVNAAKFVVPVVEVGGAAAAAGFHSVGGAHREGAARALAEVNMIQHIGKELQAMLEQVIKGFMETGGVIKEHIDSALGAIQAKDAAAVFIARKI